MNGKQLLDIAAPHVGESYILGSLVPKNNGRYTGPWDCAEFVAWCVFQLTGRLYGCANDAGNPSGADAYTGFWKRDADTLGRVITVEHAARVPGAAILRYSGSGLVGHIVLSDGKGGTIEAHSHKDGVIRSVVTGRRWDIGILIPWLDYEDFGPVPIIKPTETILRFTDPLMRGENVRAVQAALVGRGNMLQVDGVYGSHTFQAVRTFQESQGLVPDGEVGPKTLAALGL